MKNLARLTWSANKTVRLVNRSTLPFCPDCKKRVEYLPTKEPTSHCYNHMSEVERKDWSTAWDKYSDGVITN